MTRPWLIAASCSALTLGGGGCAGLLGYDELEFGSQAGSSASASPCASCPNEDDGAIRPGTGGATHSNSAMPGARPSVSPVETADGGAGGEPAMEPAATPIDCSNGNAPRKCGANLPGMVCIAGATFTLGGAAADSAFHQATVQDFYIDATEVTVDSYGACVAANACPPAAIASDTLGQVACNVGIPNYGQHPINCIRWDAANRYCRWKGLRLPTEEEWEYAARRGTPGYPWGSEPASAQRVNLRAEEWGAANSLGRDNFLTTAPVGSFPLGATADGVYDLVGNVWEFLSSRYCSFPTSACFSCAPDDTCADACDACVTGLHAVRGGSWGDPDFSWSLEHRGSWAEGPYGGLADYVGFRCARSADPLSIEP
jgi:formylglycine-generating enzyme required for sulfatase activity